MTCQPSCHGTAYAAPLFFGTMQHLSRAGHRLCHALPFEVRAPGAAIAGAALPSSRRCPKLMRGVVG
jgi:hypothetical protein